MGRRSVQLSMVRCEKGVRLMGEDRLERWQRNLDNASKNSAKAGCGVIMVIGLIVVAVVLVIVVVGILDTAI